MCGAETPELAEAAVEGGADLVELGFPFSDPLADGPVIRRAAERALAAGMRTAACLECLAQVRQRVDVPLVPMTYASLLEAYGYERFAADAAAAGAASLIVADLPAGERPDLRRVQLVTPNSTDERLGWPSRTPTAGSTSSPSPGQLGPAIASPRSSRASFPGRALTDLPLYAGFGIATPEHAHDAAALADGSSSARGRSRSARRVRRRCATTSSLRTAMTRRPRDNRLNADLLRHPGLRRQDARH